MISIVIPAFNEEESLPELIKYLKECHNSDKLEIIVSDGGSTDKTFERSKNLGAVVVLSSKKGRAAQMNLGAKIANGDILYFLHADSYPPKTLFKDISSSLEKGFEAGCYKLAFDYDHPLLKLYSWFTKFNVDYFRFGDQSLFIKKQLFKKLQGYDEILIVMEDQIFVKEIKKHSKFDILEGEVITSARKYRQVGIIKLQLIFTTILVLFYLGINQAKLVLLYKKWIR